VHNQSLMAPDRDASRQDVRSPIRITHWKKSLHIALSPPFLFKHLMLLSAASWQGSKYSLYALLWVSSACSPFNRHTAHRYVLFGM
jgi:hypothetical protein